MTSEIYGVEVGSLHESFTFPNDGEAASKRAWQACLDECSHLSCWRFSSSDKSRWLLTVMTETKAADQLLRATAIAELYGGVNTDEVEKSGMIDALRRRRFATAAATGFRTTRQEAHYGPEGARLGRDGSMTPEGGSQG
jgi:hypothetical protein